MSLQRWRENGWLLAHEPSVTEIQQLLGLVDRDLNDAAVRQLSADNRFLHAYNAALQLCALALHAHGFAVPKAHGGQHARTLESLPLVLGSEQNEIARYLSRCSTLRNQIQYDRSGVVEAQTAEELIEAVRELRGTIRAWLERTHPTLLPRDK